MPNPPNAPIDNKAENPQTRVSATEIPQLFDGQSVDDPRVNIARNPDAAIAALVHGLGTPKDENAPLLFKHPSDRLL